MTRKLLAGIAIGLGAAAFALLLGWAGPLARAELQTYDWRIRAAADSSSVSRDIVLVEINDTTVRDLEESFGRWPWPRAAFSVLLDYLARAKPSVVAVDLAFLERDRVRMHDVGGTEVSGADSDAALVAAVQRLGRVVLLADAVYMGTSGSQANQPAAWKGRPYRLGPAIEERPIVVPPFQELTDAASLGHNLLSLDEDGPARRVAPFIRVGGEYMPSLGVAAALAAAGVEPHEVVLEGDNIRVRDTRIPLVPVRVAEAADRSRVHDQLTMLINYRAPALTSDGKRPYTSFEARHLFLSEQQIQSGETPVVDPSAFTGKIVFVGLTTSGLVDVFQTPFGADGKMPGIQLHASVAESILSNRLIRPASRSLATVVTPVLTLSVGLLAAFLPFAAAAAGALALAGGWTWYAVRAFGGGLWVPLAEPLAGAGIALFAGTAYQYFVEGAQKRTVKRLFGRYVSRDVYEQLVAHPELAELGGARRDMTVLFSDIRGFTSITEKGEPEALVGQLNEYFSRMVEIVFRHHGTVDKFVGDMVMALFGAPVDDPAHAEHAVEAAVAMVHQLGELNRKWAAEGRAVLDIGIGINSGEMIAGNIGSSAIMSYTVIGDNVNLGSRLESLNKDYKTRIIISDATRERLTGTYAIRPLGDVLVKGKTRPVAIFEISVPTPVPAGGRPEPGPEARI